jgi:starvation-inducible DNA-binding protein
MRVHDSALPTPFHGQTKHLATKTFDPPILGYDRTSPTVQACPNLGRRKETMNNTAPLPTSSTTHHGFTVPGLTARDGLTVARILQERLVSLIDLSLTLKHIHWNVVGPFFIGVHTMIDPQVAGVLAMIDKTAERIATLGSAPNGLPGNLVASRTWNDYSLSRARVPEHLAALNDVFSGIISDHRIAVDVTGDLDPITQDLLIEQTASLETYQWFVRAHLESGSGDLTMPAVG